MFNGPDGTMPESQHYLTCVRTSVCLHIKCFPWKRERINVTCDCVLVLVLYIACVFTMYLKVLR